MWQKSTHKFRLGQRLFAPVFGDGLSANQSDEKQSKAICANCPADLTTTPKKCHLNAHRALRFRIPELADIRWARQMCRTNTKAFSCDRLG